MLKAKYDITDLTEKCRLMPKLKILELGSHVLLNLGAYSFISYEKSFRASDQREL